MFHYVCITSKKCKLLNIFNWTEAFKIGSKLMRSAKINMQKYSLMAKKEKKNTGKVISQDAPKLFRKPLIIKLKKKN